MKRSLFGIISLAIFMLSAMPAFAGFGITPPYVKNNSLARTSVYEQKIIISRSDPIEDLRANITIDVPGADSWISIDRGMSFTLPKGESQVPMVVRVTVPDKAKFGEYLGNVRIVMASAEGPTRGTVGIALGAQIDVAITVTDRKIFDFRIRKVQLFDAEEGRKIMGLFFPGKIRLLMQVENVGNIPFGPTRIAMEIKDPLTREVLETTENIKEIKKVNPFEIKDVIAELPTRLKPGAYKASFKIYKGQELAQQGELDLSIVPQKTLKGKTFDKIFGFSGLRTKEKAIVISLTILILGAIIFLVWYLLRRRKHRRR